MPNDYQFEIKSLTWQFCFLIVDNLLGYLYTSMIVN